jgi:hypothetical protein
MTGRAHCGSQTDGRSPTLDFLHASLLINPRARSCEAEYIRLRHTPKTQFDAYQTSMLLALNS